MPVLRTHALTKSYSGRTVVRGVSLEVSAGEVVGLLGPNGAGKTTTFYMVVGLTSPDSGRVELDGADLTHDPMYVRARKGIAYLPQEPSIFRGLTVEQNILAILETLDIDRAHARPPAARPARRARPRRTSPSRRPTRSRAASGGASRSPARWSSRRSSSCSTSRSPASTRSRHRHPEDHLPPQGSRHRRPDHRPQRTGNPEDHRSRAHRPRRRRSSAAGRPRSWPPTRR